MSVRQHLARFYNPFTPRWADRSVFVALGQMPVGSRMLNVGSGSTRLRPDIINLDVKSFPNVDVVADAHDIPFEDDSFDLVFCNAVLEHVSRPWIVAAEITRVLKPSGVVCVQSPFLEPIHDEHDYYRFTAKGLRLLFPDCKEIKSGVSGTANQLMADMLRVYPVFACEGTPFELSAKFIMSWVAKPFQYLDSVLRTPSMVNYARAVYFIGRKR